MKKRRRLDLFRDPRTERADFARAGLAALLAFGAILIIADGMAFPAEWGWGFEMSGGAWGYLGWISSTIAVWAGFGTASKGAPSSPPVDGLDGVD